METQLRVQDAIPREYKYSGREVTTASLKEFCSILRANDNENKQFKMLGPFQIMRQDIKSRRELSEAFASNTAIERLYFVVFRFNDVSFAHGLKVGVQKDQVASIEFTDCCHVGNNGELQIMCQGLRERSKGFQLKFNSCSPEVAKLIIKASYLKCFSLRLHLMECSFLENALKQSISRGALFYITLSNLTGLKESIFLELARCVAFLPRIVVLSLSGTLVPRCALKRLHGSLNKILRSGRSNEYASLTSGLTQLDDKLCFLYYGLLRYDKISVFSVCTKEGMSTAVLKSVSSSIANTKKLEHLWVGHPFSPGTGFKRFGLQERRYYYKSPFEINPGRH